MAKVYDCPECGWVTACYPNCPLLQEGDCPCYYGGSCPTDGKHIG